MSDATNATTAQARGPALRGIRKASGVSLRQLAEQSGVSYSHLSRCEVGERILSESAYHHAIAALASIASEQSKTAPAKDVA